jgi:hypothetical protein
MIFGCRQQDGAHLFISVYGVHFISVDGVHIMYTMSRSPLTLQIVFVHSLKEEGWFPHTLRW